jgi:SAM-dependent methyltransferase
MSTPFYGRPGLHVEAYDALHATVPGGDDVAFVAAAAREAPGGILELGCGTGRLAIPLAAAGFEVVGLDLSTAMLDVARAKAGSLDDAARARVVFVEGDMTAYELGRRFGVVCAVFRVFMALLDVDAQVAALSAARRHLVPGGVLIIDLFDPRVDLLVPGTHPVSRQVTASLADGSVVDAGPYERTSDMLRQVLVERWRFVERGADGTQLRVEEEELSMRWTYRYEMRHLLTLAGFDDLREYGDYAGGPPAYAAEQIWVARRAEGVR